MPTPTPKTAAVTMCRLLSPELCLCDMFIMLSRWLRFAAEISHSRHSLSEYEPRSQPRLFPHPLCAEFAHIPMRSSPWSEHHRLEGQCVQLLCLDAGPERRREDFQPAAAESVQSERRSAACAPVHRCAFRIPMPLLLMPPVRSIPPD